MFLSELITVLVVGWFVMVTPGPNMAIVIKNSLFHSRSHGVFTAAGLVLGNMVHISYCLAGIGLLISQSMFAFNIIKWLGAGYLVYLGIRALKSNKQEIVGKRDIASKSNYWASVRSGFYRFTQSQSHTILSCPFHPNHKARYSCMGPGYIRHVHCSSGIPLLCDPFDYYWA